MGERKKAEKKNKFNVMNKGRSGGNKSEIYISYISFARTVWPRTFWPGVLARGTFWAKHLIL